MNDATHEQANDPRIENPRSYNSASMSVLGAPGTNAHFHLNPTQRAWRRFLQNRPALLSGWLCLLIVGLVILWPLISPYAENALSVAQVQPLSWLDWSG